MKRNKHMKRNREARPGKDRDDLDAVRAYTCLQFTKRTHWTPSQFRPDVSRGGKHVIANGNLG